MITKIKSINKDIKAMSKLEALLNDNNPFCIFNKKIGMIPFHAINYFLSVLKPIFNELCKEL